MSFSNVRMAIDATLIAYKKKEFLEGRISLVSLLESVQHEAWICGVNRGRYEEKIDAAKEQLR